MGLTRFGEGLAIFARFSLFSPVSLWSGGSVPEGLPDRIVPRDGECSLSRQVGNPAFIEASVAKGGGYRVSQALERQAGADQTFFLKLCLESMLNCRKAVLSPCFTT